MSMRHPIRGLLLGPMVIPVAYWGGAMVHAWVTGFRVNFFQAFRELTVIAAFGLPISYAVAFVWMAPIIYLLHRLCWLRAATLVVAGALGGMIVGLGFYFAQRYTLFKVIMPLPAATLLGALAGGAIWWAAQGKGAANGSAT